MAMNTKLFLLALAIVASAAIFVPTAAASIDGFNAMELTEAFAQNMTANVTNITAANVTNMTG
jgi:hypothetical protein